MSKVREIKYNAPDVEIVEYFTPYGTLERKTVNGVEVRHPAPTNVRFFTSVTITESMSLTEFKRTFGKKYKK